MSCKMLLIATIAITLSAHMCAAQNKKLVCYYGGWAPYRQGKGAFTVDNIDANLCTHLIYSFAKLETDATINAVDPWQDLTDNGGKGGYQKLNNLKTVNPNLKTLIAIGGWNAGSKIFSDVCASSILRAKFVTNAYNFVKTYGFNGFDVDWEYPSQRDGAPMDKSNFVLLLQELKAKFSPEGLLVTVAVGAGSASAALSYNIPQVASNVDMIHLMTYDFHGSWETTTGLNSPLYSTSNDVDKTLNSDAAVKYWIQQGAPASKLVLGTATYGRSFNLQNANNAGLGAPTTGAGTKGPYTGEDGNLGYNEICESQMAGGWTLNYSNEAQAPFGNKGVLWVGYDNVKSIQVKGEYVKTQNLAGAMVWAIDTDDFLGTCGAGKFPLINALKNTINSATTISTVATTTTAATTKPTVATTTTAATTKPTVATTTTAATTKATSATTKATTATTKATTATTKATTATTKATVATTTIASTSGFTCKAAGYFRDPVNCNVFYICQLNGSTYIKNTFNCPSGLYFNTAASVCDWPANVKCP